MNLELIDKSFLIERCLNDELFFAASVSFEERSVFGGQWLVEQNIPISFVEIFDYNTKALPVEIAKKLRSEHAEQLQSISIHNNTKNIHPSASTELRNVSKELCGYAERSFVLIDITCFTRVHLISLASVLCETKPDLLKNIFFCYTEPESYGIDNKNRAGWKDTIIVPVGKPSSFRHEGHVRGIVLMGQDVERLSIALGELEPATGCLIFSHTPFRPDFLRHKLEINKSIRDRLLSLRLPRWPMDTRSTDDCWIDTIIEITDFKSLFAATNAQILAAERDEGPVALYPFGPKTLSFAASLILASQQQINAWAIYPIPDKYEVTYSRGARTIHFMKINI